MNTKHGYRTILFAGALLFGSGAMAMAQDAASQNPPASDNTQINQRDRNPNEPTADKQQNDRSDRDITQQIRKSITADKTFSEYARNIKVITQNGQVTLKGPVRTDEGKNAIEEKAKAIAGDGSVTNDLTVKPKS
jgi:hyperosmotically inducible periplasmic protein